jgi:hypothetical protein
MNGPAAGDGRQTMDDWLSTLPQFEGNSPRLALISRGDSGALYRGESNSGVAALKRYIDNAQATERPAKLRALAAAAGLRIYWPLSLAPELLWEGTLPPEIGGSGVLYRWVEGAPIDAHSTEALQVDLYAGALWKIHSEQPEAPLKLISPAPRSLDRWWISTHERYRDMPGDLREALPAEVEVIVGRLVQSVAADTHVHKRFWEGVPLAPVHGNPVPANAIVNEDRLVLVGWDRFGLGDPTYEVAGLALTLAMTSGSDVSRQLVTAYLERAADDLLHRRLDVYARLLPFARFLDGLSQLWFHSQHPSPASVLTGSSVLTDTVRYLEMTLETYGRSPAAAEAAIAQARSWLAGLAGQQAL